MQKNPSLASRPVDPPQKIIQVLGPFHSGTNLVIKLLIQNVNIPIHLRQHTIVDKHTNDENAVRQVLNSPQNIIIILYKPLYNWITSMYKESYGATILPGGTVHYQGRVYQNLIDLYNSYLSLYKKIVHHKNVVCLAYYKLLDPVTGFAYMNSQLSKVGFQLLSQPRFAQTLNMPSKNHGAPVQNYQEANAKRKQNYEITKRQVMNDQALQNSLNHELYAFFDAL